MDKENVNNTEYIDKEDMNNEQESVSHDTLSEDNQNELIYQYPVEEMRSTYEDYFKQVVCYRTHLSEEELDEVVSVTSGHLGDPYNYNFTFDTLNKSYCSDLISKVFDKVNLNLNKDGFWTTVWDIMVSPDLYITYYHYISNGVKYVYYVG